MTSADQPPAQPHTHPIVFLLLIIPFGVMSGYLTVTVAYQLSNLGVSTAQVAELVAISYLPHTWKFIWAPVADTTLTRKRWYLIAGLVSALGIAATGAVAGAGAASLSLLSGVVLVSNVAVTFLGMSVESLMAYGTAADEKGRAAGWFQAGNLGGGGLGGGLGLWIAEQVQQPWLPGALLGALCLLCCGGLWFVQEPAAAHRAHGLMDNVRGVLRDLWVVARSRLGYLGLLICFLPLGTGAASNLWATMAGEWQASAGAVATANGLLSGVVAALGCVLGGFICDRMDRKQAYALFGVVMAACAVAMALMPHTQNCYIWFVLAYAFINGLCYAAFSAVVLEAIGLGAAATKYSLFASLSNMPIAYMTVVDGWSHDRWGSNGMLFTEAAMGVLGVCVFFAVVWAVSKAKPSGALATP
jgi:MFS family permease